MTRRSARFRDGGDPPSAVRAAGLGALVMVLVLATGMSQAAQEAAVFTTPSPVATNEGHATLSWELPGTGPQDAAPRFQLQQSPSREFSGAGIRHEGHETSLFVSGLEDGPTYFRVRAMAPGGRPGPWSAPLEVQVEYPSRGRVLLLLALGGTVFLASVGAIVAGWSRTRGGETPGASTA